MNRRRFLAGLAATATATAFGAGAIAGDKLGPTPPADLPVYRGDPINLFNAPWQLEGMLVTLDGVIRAWTVAPDGSSIIAGEDQRHYRATLAVYVPDAGGEITVATNADLAPLKGRYTVRVVGTYAGQDGYQPFVVARSIGPVPAAPATETPCAS